MSEQLYPSIPDADEHDLKVDLEQGYSELVWSRRVLVRIAVHYARRAATAERQLAEIKAAVMPILGSFNATADDGRLIGLVSVEAATRALELVAPDERKDAI